MGPTLYRLKAVLVVLSACVLFVNPLLPIEKIDRVYSLLSNNKVTADSLSCEGVVGSVSVCSDCYSCDDQEVEKYRHEDIVITELTLNDANCNSSETICCVSQRDLRFREKENADQSKCGNSNPDGYPRALRPKIRSVLQGEYPWRARIYHAQDPSKPLCSATYIHEEGRTLLTAASCVAGRMPGELHALFDDGLVSYEPLGIRSIDVHKDYKRGSHENDIAALSLTAVPSWARRACLPIVAALHSTPCIAVSSDDYFINQVVPRSSKCGDNDTSLDASLMCAVAHRGDYAPEFGAGLYCINEQSKSNVYTMYGVYLHSARNGLVAVYANVTHFADWMLARTLQHRRLRY